MSRFTTLFRYAAVLGSACKAASLLVLGGMLTLSLGGCAVSAGGPAASTAQKEAAAESTGVIPSQFFGMVVKDSSIQPAVASGARRLWDSGVSWAALEPARGGFDWATLDAEVDAAQEAGVEVTLTLGMTPEWASSSPGTASGYGAGATAMPAQIADWDTYVATVASRYRGRIAAYEVWNAPEDPRYWGGAAAEIGTDMATLAVHTAAAVHGADAAARVVSPALSPAGLSAFLAAGGGASVDAIGTALVGAGQSPEALAATVQGVRAAMVGTPADGKPLWGDGGSWTLPQGGLSDADQAAYVARALILSAGYAVERMHWYAWDDKDAGVLALTDAGGQPTPAAAAYGAVESWLAGARMNGCAASANGLWTCQVAQGAATEWIVWSSAGVVRGSSMGASTVTDLHGNVTAPGADGSVEVGGSPVLLR